MLAGVLLACAAAAQLPQIGDIEFYGLRKITAEQILSAVGLAAGDTVPASKGALEDQIADIPGVVAAHVQAECCEGNRSTLFIGIVERGEPQPAFHLPPDGEATLPQNSMDSYREFQGAVLRAAMKGSVAEDLTAGHALSADPLLRGFEDGFAAFAAGNEGLLREVLRGGQEPEERAAAATMIGYAPDKKEVAGDLLHAVEDPDEGVRVNAVRSLAAIAVLARKKPALGIRVEPTLFVDLLNSAVLSDRVESTKALLLLTEGGDSAALDLVREQALAAVVEMARLKTPRYAQPPFLLLGRVAGLADAQTNQLWEKGDRDAVIQKALDTAAGKHRE
jgi:hypothetical protein